MEAVGAKYAMMFVMLRIYASFRVVSLRFSCTTVEPGLLRRLQR